MLDLFLFTSEVGSQKQKQKRPTGGAWRVPPLSQLPAFPPGVLRPARNESLFRSPTALAHANQIRYGRIRCPRKSLRLRYMRCPEARDASRAFALQLSLRSPATTIAEKCQVSEEASIRYYPKQRQWLGNGKDQQASKQAEFGL